MDRRTFVIGSLSSFVAAVVAACGSGSTGNNPPPPPPPPPPPVPPPAGATVTFDVGDDFFRDPQSRLNGNAMVTVNTGQTVGWRHIGSNPHTVTSDSGPESFDSGTLNNGQTFTFTPTVAGTYTFHCDFHPATMLGSTIQVN